MKKIISVKCQKIIMFIPLVNFSILFIWLYNYAKTQTEYKVFSKSLLIIFISTIPLEIVNMIICKSLIRFENITNIINFIMQYLVGISLGFALIKYQIKTIKFD